jgi:hypothetical protein
LTHWIGCQQSWLEKTYIFHGIDGPFIGGLPIKNGDLPIKNGDLPQSSRFQDVHVIKCN